MEMTFVFFRKTRHTFGLLAILLAFAIITTPNVIAAEQVITLDISANRSVANCSPVQVSPLLQSYLLVDAPDPNTAAGVLLLFVGGGGKLALADSQLNITSANFLLRSRYLFAAQGFHVAVMDAANDFLLCNGGLRNRRTSGKFTKDMEAVINDLKARFPGSPVWAVGTSRGTVAAAQAATMLGHLVDGLVLTSPMTNPVTASVFDTPLETVTVPTMITVHEQDGCFVTPPSGMESVKDALVSAPVVKTKEFDDGFPPVSPDPCDATTQHGYLGLEPKVVNKITKWIKKVQLTP